MNLDDTNGNFIPAEVAAMPSDRSIPNIEGWQEAPPPVRREAWEWRSPWGYLRVQQGIGPRWDKWLDGHFQGSSPSLEAAKAQLEFTAKSESRIRP